MANRLMLHLDDWKAELVAEPDALAASAADPVRAAAEDAADELRSAYPVGETGNLRGGVRVDEPEQDGATAAAIVVSGAPHAHLYEDGTRYARAHPTFYPITDRHGRGMLQDVNSIVEDRGYRITGAVD
jgi:hypothetical protein